MTREELDAAYRRITGQPQCPIHVEAMVAWAMRRAAGICERVAFGRESTGDDDCAVGAGECESAILADAAIKD